MKKFFEKPAPGVAEKANPEPLSPAPPYQPQAPIIMAQAPAQVPIPGPFGTNLCCVTLNKRDTIRFLNFPFVELQIFRDAIARSWVKGIYGLTQYGQAWEVKMHGFPWQSVYNGDDPSRKLIIDLLATMYDRGWVLYTTLDFSKKSDSKGIYRNNHSCLVKSLLTR